MINILIANLLCYKWNFSFLNFMNYIASPVVFYNPSHCFHTPPLLSLVLDPGNFIVENLTVSTDDNNGVDV